MSGYEATSLAGAFLIGLMAGVVITIRLTRVIAEHLPRRRDNGNHDSRQ